MNRKANKINQYYIIGQHSNSLIEIGIRGQTLQLRRTAKEVLANNELFDGFSITEKALINKISITENNKTTSYKRKKLLKSYK